MLPQVLIIHLRRFSTDQWGRPSNKDTTVVKFPHRLDLRDAYTPSQASALASASVSAQRSAQSAKGDSEGNGGNGGGGSRGFGRYQQQRPLYRLFAVSNHMGGLNSGHYTAYARHRGKRKWYYFDDSSVREVRERDLPPPPPHPPKQVLICTCRLRSLS